MGDIYRFHCPACGYNAKVSGGSDAGGAACRDPLDLFQDRRGDRHAHLL